jgi:hypothetical protein
MRIKRVLIAVAVAAGSWVALGGSATAGLSREGCVAASGTFCSYRAHVRGGILAAGNGWYVEIARGHRTIWFGPRSMTDVGHGLVARKNVIKRGDRVFVSTDLAACPCLCAQGKTGFVQVGPDANRT